MDFLSQHFPLHFEMHTASERGRLQSSIVGFQKKRRTLEISRCLGFCYCSSVSGRVGLEPRNERTQFSENSLGLLAAGLCSGSAGRGGFKGRVLGLQVSEPRQFR